ncbi:MAG: hypothetical protein NVS3B5_22210 [Sphingomicrobium sp.]
MITYCYPMTSAGNVITVNGMNYNWLNPPPTMGQSPAPAETIPRAPYTPYTATTAAARALRLLMSLLNEEQAAQYRSERAFEVRGHSGRRYRLRHGWARNIEVLTDEGRVTECLCIHPNQALPFADNLLMQKLFLETDEVAFRRLANITPPI